MIKKKNKLKKKIQNKKSNQWKSSKNPINVSFKIKDIFNKNMMKI